MAEVLFSGLPQQTHKFKLHEPRGFSLRHSSLNYIIFIYIFDTTLRFIFHDISINYFRFKYIFSVSMYLGGKMDLNRERRTKLEKKSTRASINDFI